MIQRHQHAGQFSLSGVKSVLGLPWDLEILKRM